MTVSLAVSIEQLGSTGRIFMKFGISGFLKSRENSGLVKKKTLDEELCIFMILLR